MKSNEDANTAIDRNIGVEQIIEWYRGLNERNQKGRSFSIAIDAAVATMVNKALNPEGANVIFNIAAKNMKNYRHNKTVEGVKGLMYNAPKEKALQFTPLGLLNKDIADIKSMCQEILIHIKYEE